MSWTNIDKPTVSSYSSISKPGALSYTNIAKPFGSIIGQWGAGRATGLIIPPTYNSSLVTTAETWVNINKPT